MDDVLVIGAGPAGLLAAWVARKRGASVRVLAAGIGTTHVSAGWIQILDGAGNLADTLASWVAAHPAHPYALAGIDALRSGITALQDVCAPAGLNYVGRAADVALSSNFRLPTALGAIKQVALAPETLAEGDLDRPGAMLIAGPSGWRDFYPELCAGNLARQGFKARSGRFELPELHAGKFDPTPGGLARLFDGAEVRARVAQQIKALLNGAARVGLPAIVGLKQSRQAWLDLQERLGVPVFEIPTLPPCVPGMRLYDALNQALTHAGVQILLDMPVAGGQVENGKVVAVAVPGAARDRIYRARQVILATGGLYGGGIATDYRGEIRETVFGLPIRQPTGMGEWFDDTFLGECDHAINTVGVTTNRQLQPVDAGGNPILENLRAAGRLLGGYSPVREGSTEGAWLATAYRAAEHATA